MSSKEQHISNSTPLSFGEGQGVRIIISGGGTGGHIYPAIAIANELRSRFPDCEILFVGARDKMEMQKVPQAGYNIEGLWISGIQRKLTLQNAMFPLKLIDSLMKSRKIIKKFKPDVVIGTGGFASGAVVRVAQQMGIPTVIQEQNSYPGITNKLLSKKAKAICVAYDGLEKFFPKEKIVFTGNPVRQDLLNIDSKKEEAITTFNFDRNKKTLLVLGGSLGARRINQLIEKEMDFILSQDVQIIWQCGKFYYDEYKKYDSKSPSFGGVGEVKVLPFIDRMDLVYGCADVIISRAGASSVSELSIVGKPTIFIPSPNVAEDHQTKNAKAISDKNGAILIKESELDIRFQDVFSEVVNNKELQKELSQNIKELAKPNATKDIVDEIVKLTKASMSDKYSKTDVLKQHFSFLEKYGLKIVRDSNFNYGAYVDYAGNGIKVSLGFDYKDYFFYFYIYKGEDTEYSDNDSERIKTFYDLVEKRGVIIDYETLQPNYEQGYKKALENNAKILEEYGKNILTGKEWF